MNRDKMAEGIRTFLEGIGEGFDGDDAERTAARVAEAWARDLVSGYGADPQELLTWTPTGAGAGPVLVRGISLASVCAHHLLPFFGQAHVAYLPGERQAGLSKLSRVVDAHARRLQTQERLTRAIVKTMEEVLRPRGAIAVIGAEHTCMTLRGVRKERGRMVTVETTGLYAGDPAMRVEVLDLLTR